MVNSNLIPSLVVALVVTIAFMFIFRPVATGIGLVDYPGGRKTHAGIVPVIGGIAMFLGIFSGILLLGLPLAFSSYVLLASFLLVTTGVVDDHHGLPAVVRMLTQVGVVILMFYGLGLRLYDIGDPFGTGIIEMGRFTFVFTMLVTLTTINSYNLIDGADGLAGSLAVVALLSVAAVTGVGNVYSAAALVVSSAALGFLLFNFPTSWNTRFRSFMGDAGSTLLGFTIVWITLGVCQGAERVISPVHCLWFAALPIFDLLTCFVRRALRGKSPIRAGRDHVHHVLLRGGFRTREKLVILSGIQTLYAIVGITGHFAGVPDYVMFAAWSIAGVSQGWAIRLIARTHRFRQLKGQLG